MSGPLTSSFPSAADRTAAVLAPHGRLRAAINLGNPVLAQRAADGRLQGTSVRLAEEAARRLGLALELVPFEAAGRVFEALGRDAWDVAFMAIDPLRAEQIAFTRPYVVVEGSYLVGADSPLYTCADVDRPGRRVVASFGSAYELHLRRALQHAALVAPPTPEDSFQTFVGQRLDALAGIRPALHRAAQRAPGTRVLPDSFLQIRQAMGVPRRAAACLPWLDGFIAEAKASGLVARALEDTGQADAAVAPD